MPGNSAYARAGVLVSQMTTEEKENVIHGWPGLCVGNTGALSLYFTGGPVGIRGQELVSPFRPQPLSGPTRDKELMYRYGRAPGHEYYAKGINLDSRPGCWSRRPQLRGPGAMTLSLPVLAWGAITRGI